MKEYHTQFLTDLNNPFLDGGHALYHQRRALQRLMEVVSCHGDSIEITKVVEKYKSSLGDPFLQTLKEQFDEFGNGQYIECILVKIIGIDKILFDDITDNNKKLELLKKAEKRILNNMLCVDSYNSHISNKDVIVYITFPHPVNLSGFMDDKSLDILETRVKSYLDNELDLVVEECSLVGVGDTAGLEKTFYNHIFKQEWCLQLMGLKTRVTTW